MRYRFENFELDADNAVLLQDGAPVHAEPQVLDLLTELVKRPHSTLSKDDLLDAVWPGKVVSDAALSSRIKSLRQVLGDNGKEQRLLKTIHKKGFRFIAEVNTDSTDTSPTETTPPSSESATPAHRKPRIAVLPLRNLSSNPDQDYLAEGISSDIIGHLSKYPWLEVVARNTAFGLHQRTDDLQTITEQLNLDYLVEGSLQRAGDRLRIQIHLNDTRNHATLWSDRYDRNLVDIFDLQDEITETIVARLEPELGQLERAKVLQRKPVNLQAWDCFHLGTYHFFKFTDADNLKAQDLLKQSLALDAEFAAAYAWWAYAHARVLGMVYWTTEPTQAHLDEALQASDKAVALEPRNASFRMLRARVLLARREYDAAIQENHNAIELNPSFAAAYCGLGDSLAYECRYDEAITYFEKSIALSPNDPQLWAFYTYGALALIFKGEHTRAIDWLNIAQTIPNFQYWTLAHKCVALYHLQRQQEASDLLTQITQQNPWFTLEFVRAKLFYLKDQEQIELYLETLREMGLS